MKKSNKKIENIKSKRKLKIVINRETNISIKNFFLDINLFQKKKYLYNHMIILWIQDILKDYEWHQ